MTELVPLRTNTLARNEQGQQVVLTPEGTVFELTPEWLARFQDEYGNWREEDWPMIQAIMICRTNECPRNGIQQVITLAENVDGVFRAGCGPCGNAPDLYELP